MTEMMLSTLREMSTYPNCGQYWFRQASCKKLEALGYCERIGTRKRPPFRITEAGRRYLASLSESTS